MPHLTDWFMRSRWGVNITFMASGGEKSWGAGLSADEWNRRVDAFDVDGLAAQLGALNVPYCFLRTPCTITSSASGRASVRGVIS